ncbi:hypothetical protein [Sagittula salina]|uniref:Uncharacterized protein n=1 Tax=Sagittula salina TaxID=2820268 RepID=A0A940S561_9RHOB|nr:hypothetical protein [Sagittula salina]MBP0484819.1 hypothetical protein [Sagittula salina]
MAWKVDVSRTAREDLRTIYRHLVNVQHTQFGHGLAAAEKLATDRLATIRRNA